MNQYCINAYEEMTLFQQWVVELFTYVILNTWGNVTIPTFHHIEKYKSLHECNGISTNEIILYPVYEVKIVANIYTQNYYIITIFQSIGKYIY